MRIFLYILIGIFAGKVGFDVANDSLTPWVGVPLVAICVAVMMAILFRLKIAITLA